MLNRKVTATASFLPCKSFLKLELSSQLLVVAALSFHLARSGELVSIVHFSVRPRPSDARMPHRRPRPRASVPPAPRPPLALYQVFVANGPQKEGVSLGLSAALLAWQRQSETSFADGRSRPNE